MDFCSLFNDFLFLVLLYSPVFLFLLLFRPRSSKSVVRSARKFELESRHRDPKRLMKLRLVEEVGEFQGEAAVPGVKQCEIEGRGSKREREEDGVVVGLEEKIVEENSGEGKVGSVNEFKGEEKGEFFNPEEFPSEGTEDAGEIELDLGEVEIVKLEEKSSNNIGGVQEFEGNLIDQSPEREVFSKVEIELVKDEVDVAKSESIQGLESEHDSDGEINGVKKNEERLFEEEDDWEGIETTELEKRFGAAVVYAGSSCNADQIRNIGSDMQLQLYGLHKLATEGPCRDPQPMAFKVSARAKWNAWQKLGDMSPEVAMEQYITLLSSGIPGWLREDPDENERQVSADTKASGKLDCDLNQAL